MTVETALAIAATTRGHAVSCTSATLASDCQVACKGFVTFALSNGVLLTGTSTLLADKDTGIVEFGRPVRKPSVGKENASSEKVEGNRPWGF